MDNGNRNGNGKSYGYNYNYPTRLRHAALAERASSSASEVSDEAVDKFRIGCSKMAYRNIGTAVKLTVPTDAASIGNWRKSVAVNDETSEMQTIPVSTMKLRPKFSTSRPWNRSAAVVPCTWTSRGSIPKFGMAMSQLSTAPVRTPFVAVPELFVAPRAIAMPAPAASIMFMSLPSPKKKFATKNRSKDRK